LNHGKFASVTRIYELSNERSRYPQMEGIRRLAILLVFFVHYHTLYGSYASTTSWTFKISHFAWGLGHSGVDLFFVLSGFLIYGSLIRKPVNYFRFLRRRVQRIYPAFLVVFSVYICLSLIFPSFSKFPSGWWPTTKYIVLNLALMPGIFAVTPIISVAWSLSYEFFLLPHNSSLSYVFLDAPLEMGRSRRVHSAIAGLEIHLFRRSPPFVWRCSAAGF
jgi:peptidoglycan/LPS O-acetylase OafA/YrhL